MAPPPDHADARANEADARGAESDEPTAASAPAAGEPVTLAQPRQPPERVKMQLRLIGASALLLFTVLAMVVVIAYLMRAWRRQNRLEMPPTRFEPDAWARKSLAPKDTASDDKAP